MDDKIIKSGAISGLGIRKVLKQEVYSATLEAKDLVADAHEQAEVVLKEAQEKAEEIKNQAREQGFNEGLASWNKAIADAMAAREQTFRDNEQQIVQLAVKIAEKIIGERLDADPGAIVAIIRQALKSVHRERSLIIKVNPEHEEVVRSQVAALVESTGGQREIQVVASAAVPVGGCVVESEFGVIDAKLETQLKCLEDILLRTGN
jgi:type III secretion system HrpE/YscL family protein